MASVIEIFIFAANELKTKRLLTNQKWELSG